MLGVLKIRIQGFYRKIKNSRDRIKDVKVIKYGDVIIQKLPIDENGLCLVDFALACEYHKRLVEAFPNNTVRSTPYDLEIYHYDKGNK